MRELATSNRSCFFARAGQVAAIVTLTIMIAGGCGSVNSAGGDAAAGASGQGGNAGNGASGAAGSGGTSTGRGGGGGFAGSAGGSAGSDGCGPGYPVGSSRPAGDGCNGCSCLAPGTWVCSAASCPIGGAGGGGTTGGAGGGGTTGAGGTTGGGGAGGSTSPCQAVLALDRSCTTPADCFAGAHTINCCGTAQYVGFRNSVKTELQTLEAACDATYPICGCPIQQPTTDDGSVLRFGGEPGVTCLQGKCTTFVPDCGQPCGSGSTCFSCVNHQQMFAACTTMCAGNSQCRDPSLPLCQMGMSGNTAGKFCTAANVACDTK